MPRSDSASTLARQWELLKQLPAGPPGITTRALVDKLSERGYAISKRSVERDLHDLSRVFPLVCNDKGVPHGWHWMKGASLDLPALGVADALSLRLLEEYLQSLLPASILGVLRPRFEEATRKLEQLGDTNSIAGWADKVRVVPPTLPLLPPVIKAGVLEAVQEALLQGRQLKCNYRSASGKKSNRRLHPLALVQRGSVSYLVATTIEIDDVRLYALHRMQRAETTEDKTERPKDFNIDDYIATGALQFGNGKTLRLRASIDEELANQLNETPLSEDMRIVERTEDYLLTATVADSWQLRWWLLSWGSAVEVLGPQRLREEIKRQIISASEVYFL